MKTSTIAAFLSVFLLAGSAALTAQGESKATTQQLIEQLGDPDYQTRKSAEKQLLQRGEKSLEALRKSAKSHSDAEVQWRAGRLMRRIETGGKAERRTLGKRDRKSERKRDRKPERKAERGDRPPRQREVADVLEEFGRIFEGQHLDNDARKQMERWLEQMRKRAGDFDVGGGFGFGPGAFRDFTRDSRRGMKMQQGPDGVRVEITETGEDGKPKTKVYEAESMEAFKKKYPGVLGNDSFRIDAREFPFPGGFKVFGPDAFRGQLRRQRDRNDVDHVEKTKGKQLGFYVGEISPAIRDYLDLEGGLMVAGVVEGTIAAKLGVRKGDIVTVVGSRRIREVSDVAKALDEIGDAKVSIAIIRRGRELTLR